MKEFVYHLKKETEEGIANPYTGTATLKILPYIERNALLKEVNFSTDGGEVSIGQNIDALNKLVGVCKKQVIKFEVKNNGEIFTDWDEVDYHEDVASLYLDIGMFLLKGIRLGKDSEKKSKQSVG